MTRHFLSRRRMLGGAAGAGAALVAGSAAGAASAAGAPAPDPYQLKLPHQIEAETLIDYLRMRPWSEGANRYKTAGQFPDENSAVTWGAPGHPEQFSALAQCSSFLTLVLQRAYGTGTAYGWATRDYFSEHFKTEPGKFYPTAEKFREGFANAPLIPHFTGVTKPVNLRPGDLVAFDYDADATTKPYTGHIVMIRQRKGTWASAVDGQVGEGVVPYVFEIIDCTSDPHGSPAASASAEATYRAFPDTRIEEASDGASGWTEHNGAGYGHIVFYGDPVTKLFAGYRWSVNSSTPRKVADRPIAAARVHLTG
ncbi:hypothetical protein [Streptomyces ficellus]|uniref:CHAP domain-containing protein n=1 Tax=Streptomyces ficellus TaxID=1977088 RepID=A0A6I6FIJ1_9ACTN|nr:hypothetical protein [Streptomyces ficellus]QGV77308.1 hypothetical protein EIZ62_02835 [Streptomyces ficellus]